MAEAIRQQGLVAGFVHSAWMPDWYLGDPMRVYYPPLTAWILGPLTALVNDVFIAYRLLVTGIVLGLSLSVYSVGRRWGHSRWLAATGALLAVMAPYTLRTIFAEGNLPRGLALLPLPWIFLFTEATLTRKDAASTFALLAGLWAVTFVAHVMQAPIFALAVGIYVVVRLVGDVYIPLRRGVLALAPVAAGGLLAAFYLLPAYSRAELANVPSLPAIKIDLFSVPPSALLPHQTDIEAVSIGVLTAALAVVVMFRMRRRHHTALLAAGVLCALAAFGPAGGVFQFVPLNQLFLPERFLNASTLIFPLMIATATTLERRWLWLVGGFALVWLVEFTPAWRVVHLREAPPDETALAAALSQADLPGRVAPLTLPNPTAPLIYLTSIEGKHANIAGWALENTPHALAIRRLLTAATSAPAYLERLLSLWNVDYLITRDLAETEAPALDPNLPYRMIARYGTLRLWERTTPSAFVHALPDRRMLVIGDNPTSWLFAFPFAAEGERPDPQTYTPEDLKPYTVIGLARFPASPGVEPALADWVRQGNTLIVDLSGVGSLAQQGFTLFGVHALPLTVEAAPAAAWPAELQGMPDRLRFPMDEGAWVGATYFGLDETVATITYNDQTYPLLGYRTIGEGRVWFISLNLLYYLDVSGQREATARLVDYLLADVDVDRRLALPRLDIARLQREPTQIAFDYQSPKPVSAVVSMTYFPRWQAAVDDAPLAVRSHEHLLRLDLPAGQHRVTLTYTPYTAISFIGLLMSGLTAGSLGVGLVYLRRYGMLARSDREGHFEDRLAQPRPVQEIVHGFAVCPACGYDQARIGPPTAESYPFVSIACPQCGFTLDTVHQDDMPAAPSS